jgi:hypothetical protein
MNLQNEVDQTLASYIPEPVLVHLLASAARRIRRINAIEAAALDLLFDPARANLSFYHKTAAAMGYPARIPGRLFRQRNAAERSYHKALAVQRPKTKIQNERTRPEKISNLSVAEGIRALIERQKLHRQDP